MTDKTADSIEAPGGVVFQLPERFGRVCKDASAVVIRGGDGLLICVRGRPVATCSWNAAASMDEVEESRLRSFLAEERGASGGIALEADPTFPSSVPEKKESR